MDNPNATAVKIANGTLSAICRAVGVMRPKKSEELHSKPLIAKVGIEEYQGEKRNKIKGYAKTGGGSKSEPAPENGGASKPPWAK